MLMWNSREPASTFFGGMGEGYRLSPLICFFFLLCTICQARRRKMQYVGERLRGYTS